MDMLKIYAIIFGIPLLAIVDMFRFRATTWRRSGQSRALWVALALVLNLLGAALYFTGPRLVLRRTVREMRAEALAA
ncbi:PLDc N-terminal domain-containing protein [Nocardioides sp. WV_118_6]